MNAAAHDKTTLDSADRLAQVGLRAQSPLSYQQASDEASALALVSIARSLESIAATFDRSGGALSASKDGSE